jgi:hypothetical protein
VTPDSTDTIRPAAPSSIPPAPKSDAPEDIATAIAYMKHLTAAFRVMVNTQGQLTDRLNQYLPDQDDMGSRVHELERRMRAASVALDQPDRPSLRLPTHTNGNGDAE